MLSDTLCNLRKSNDETDETNDVQKYTPPVPYFDSNHLLEFILVIQYHFVVNSYLTCTQSDKFAWGNQVCFYQIRCMFLYYWQTFSDILNLDQER